MQKRRGVGLALLLVGVAGLAAIGLSGDLRALGDQLGDFAWWTFAAALGLSLANYAIRFVRWQYYLRRVGATAATVPTGSSALIFGAGLSLAISPGKIGEVIKSYYLTKLHDLPATSTAPLVIAERITDLLALLVLAVIGVAAYGLASTFVLVAAVCLGAGLVLLAWPTPMRALIRIVTTPMLLARFRAPMLTMYEGLAQACRPVPLLIATGLAIPAWLCECVGFALIVRGFGHDAGTSVQLGLGIAIMIYATATIAGALSFLPGGLGVTEAGMTLLLVKGAAHVARPTAVAATLLTRLATLWFAVLLGLGCLALVNRRVTRRAARRAALTTPGADDAARNPAPTAAPDPA